MRLELISPEKIIFSGEVELVTLPGVVGKFTVLPGHAPIVSVLTKGVVVYQIDKKKTEVSVNGGFVEVNGETISVCVD